MPDLDCWTSATLVKKYNITRPENRHPPAHLLLTEYSQLLRRVPDGHTKGTSGPSHCLNADATVFVVPDALWVRNGMPLSFTTQVLKVLRRKRARTGLMAYPDGGFDSMFR
jgi:hypothetical protein